MSNENKILHKDLSYKLQGLFFDIRNDLGSGHKESIYQKALEKELNNTRIKFTKEPAIKIYSRKGDYLGLYRPDFLVEKEIIIELKATPRLSRQEAVRIYDYLRNSEYELLYLVNFASPQLYIRRYLFTNDRKSWLTAIKSLLLFVAVSMSFWVISGLPKAEAAQFFFGGVAQEVGVNQKLRVDLFINTEGKETNTFGGIVTFPRNLLELKEVRDGNSIVNFWVDKPQIAMDNNELVFSGITPGSYNGKKGLIFSLIFEAKNEGEGAVGIKERRLFLNDGRGTELKTDSQEFPFVAIRDSIRGDSWTTKDIESPETFRPEVARDETLFDGKWFVVFATQDKASGIVHYEIKESRGRFFTLFRKWSQAESPRVLQDQELRSYIFIKAVDKNGNERVVMLPPQKPRPWYQNYAILVILIIIGLWLRFIKSR